jgi:predicted protein tyrosine phosphatase
VELDVTWLTPSLAMGGAFPAEAAVRLAHELGVHRVVDLRAECCDDVEVLRGAGIELLHLPTDDVCASSPDHLELGVAWITEQLAAGERVLVHCQWGIGRSTVLALCVLVAQGMDPLAALTHAKDLRARVSPSPAQLRAFLAFCERRGLRAPGFEELARVAYRHLQAAASDSDRTRSSTKR